MNNVLPSCVVEHSIFAGEYCNRFEVRYQILFLLFRSLSKNATVKE